MRKLSLLLIALLAICSISCSNTKRDENPFFTEWDTSFGMPPFGEIKPGYFLPAFEKGMEMQLAEIDEIINNTAEPTFANVILALDNAGELLNKVNAVYSWMSTADNNIPLQAGHEKIAAIQGRQLPNIYQNAALFNKVALVYDNRENAGLNAQQLRLLEKMYTSFVRWGGLLNPEEKSQLGDIICRHIADQELFVENLKAENKNTYDESGMIKFLTDSDNRDLRETHFKEYISRCNDQSKYDNRKLINEIVDLRKAGSIGLLGADTYADFMIYYRMAPDADAVYKVIDQLWEPAQAAAAKELGELKKLKRDETGNDDFQSWDWWYYAEKMRKKKDDLDEQLLMPYFSLSQVQSGIFELCNRLYGITFRPANNLPVYNKDCSAFEVLDKDKSHLGILIMDLQSSAGKANVTRHGSYQMRTFDGTGNKTADPILYITANFAQPSADQPVLLTLDETARLFHESGHVLHNLFASAPYRGLWGTEPDFAELPAQFMENRALAPQMLRSYASHYSDNTPIPDDLIEKIIRRNLFNQGFTFTEQIASIYLDLDIHSTKDTDLDINAFEQEMLHNKRGMIKEIAPRYRLTYFKDIFESETYAAGYYGDTWAEILAWDACEAFNETGDIFNGEVADSFRKNILEKGGSQDGATMYRNFRGKEASVNYLLYAKGLKERPAMQE